MLRTIALQWDYPVVYIDMTLDNFTSLLILMSLFCYLLKLYFPQFIVIRIVNKAEIDVFLKLSCFFDDPMDVGNLISGSYAFSKTSLNIWTFIVHILLKPGLENFEVSAIVW